MSNIPADLQQDARKQVTVCLDGIPFTGTLIRAYSEPNHDIILAVQVKYYEVCGVRFAAEENEVPLRVSASTLVETAEVA